MHRVWHSADAITRHWTSAFSLRSKKGDRGGPPSGGPPIQLEGGAASDCFVVNRARRVRPSGTSLPIRQYVSRTISMTRVRPRCTVPALFVKTRFDQAQHRISREVIDFGDKDIANGNPTISFTKVHRGSPRLPFVNETPSRGPSFCGQMAGTDRCRFVPAILPFLAELRCPALALFALPRSSPCWKSTSQASTRCRPWRRTGKSRSPNTTVPPTRRRIFRTLPLVAGPKARPIRIPS